MMTIKWQKLYVKASKWIWEKIILTNSDLIMPL